MSNVVVVVLAAAIVYYRVGWWRMESACATTNSNVSYGWSWQPPGFQCTYANGRTETSLWF